MVSTMQTISMLKPNLFQERNFYILTNSNFSKIEEQISVWLDKMRGEEFAEKNLTEVLESIAHHKPGISLISEKNQKVYHKAISTYLESKMKKGKIYDRAEMKDLIVRFLLKLTNPNSEFDILTFHKVINSNHQQYICQKTKYF